MMIWRDDDVAFDTRLEYMIAVDDLFQQYGQPHTVAIVADRLDTNPDLVSLIKDRGMIVQLHCWQHFDLRYNDKAQRSNLPRAVDMLERLFGARPTVLYPPWNRSNRDVEAAAAALGMVVSTAKISLDQYIRAGGDVSEDTVNFHHWYVPEALKLERALALAAGVTLPP